MRLRIDPHAASIYTVALLLAAAVSLVTADRVGAAARQRVPAAYSAFYASHIDVRGADRVATARELAFIHMIAAQSRAQHEARAQLAHSAPPFSQLLRAEFRDGVAGPRFDGRPAGQFYPTEHIAYAALVRASAARWHVDPALVDAVISMESGFNPLATSRCGAMGLMQLSPAMVAALGITDAYDPAQNIAGGVRYLRGLLDRFGGNVELALAAYNAGPNAVERYGGVPPYGETQHYVAAVLRTYSRFRRTD